jgi:ABC-2 type transport system ATP-binding protein
MTHTEESILEVRNLVKKYDGLVAVGGVSFSVRKKEIFGILGPNGAGKTSTLEMIETLRPIDGGEVLLNAINVSTHPQEVKRVIGVQLQSSSFFDTPFARLTFLQKLSYRIRPEHTLVSCQADRNSASP